MLCKISSRFTVNRRVESSSPPRIKSSSHREVPSKSSLRCRALSLPNQALPSGFRSGKEKLVSSNGQLLAFCKQVPELLIVFILDANFCICRNAPANQTQSSNGAIKPSRIF
ncbi:hypothetical protein Bca101_023170 [Brassica carinata]